MPEDIGLFEAMYSQRAIRRLKPDPVPDELVYKLIEAATKAPSGGNTQPWSFIVIRNAETKQRIGEWYREAWDKTYGALPEGQRATGNMARVYGAAEHLAFHLGEVPVMIMVCVKGVRASGRTSAAALYGSIYPAVQNLLLAALGLGLGASLTTLHKMREPDVKELLGIPDEVETVALIPIGYPIGKYGPTTRRPVAEVVHEERWGAKKT